MNDSISSNSRTRDPMICAHSTTRARRWTVKSVALQMRRNLSLPLIAALLVALPAAGQDAMFRGNLAHTGVYAGTGVQKLNGIKWKFQTGGRVISSPAVADGVVYIGSTDRNLYALDLESGAQKWKFTTESSVVSSPAVSGNSVYFGSYDGRFYALDVNTGKLVWKFETAGEKRYAAKHLHYMLPKSEAMPDPWDFFLSSPSVWNGVVYFGSGDGNVYALDAASGNLKWKFQTGDVVHSSPAIADGMLYIGSWDGYLYALNASTGEKKWSFRTGDDPDVHNHVGIQSSPMVADGTVYFGCRDSNVYALDAATGKQKWFYATQGSWVNNSPTLYDGKLYFGWSLPGRWEALDAKTGKLLSTVDSKVPIFSSLAISHGLLYAGTFDGKLTAYDLTNQKPVWVFQTDASKQNSAALTNPDGTFNWNTIFESSFPSLFYDDMVVGVRKLFTVGAILSSPVVVNNMVYVGSTDGNLYALM
jgi:eukaryotic-like serine/threonine-protein kinase